MKFYGSFSHSIVGLVLSLLPTGFTQSSGPNAATLFHLALLVFVEALGWELGVRFDHFRPYAILQRAARV